MLNFEEIEKLLESRGLALSGPLAKHDGDRKSVYAFVEISRNKDGHQKPSNLQLNKISAELEDQGIEIHYILNDVSGQDLASGLRATLLNAFPDHIRNAFLALDKKSAVVWIVPKASSVREEMEQVTLRAKTYLENAEFELDEVRLTIDEKLPTRTAILSELRIAAPASLDVLIKRLTAKGFTAPPEDYVNRHLDALRKSDKVVRSKSGEYCLTASALKVLGTIKRRSSPDIIRFLDLARRGSVK